MDFLENLWNRARGVVDSSQGSSQDPGRSQHSQANQQHSAGGMQYQGNEGYDTESGGKEIRTYRREGINMIEEYERLNPDGTVTKTISVGDKKNGLKKFEVYKMDKSGIVRRIENAGIGDRIGPEALRDIWMNDFKMADNLKERAVNDNDTKQSANAMQYLNSLTPEQKTDIYNQFKERLLAYGTDKLKNILIPKLDKNGTELGLTNQEKVEVLEAGIQKLRRRLSEGVSEEKFFTEVWPRYGLSKINENGDINTSSSHVSFALQPNNAQHGSSDTKPISFVIRPEYSTPSHSQSTPQSSHSSEVNNGWEDEKVQTYHTKKFSSNESTENKYMRFTDAVDDTLNKLHQHLTWHIQGDPSTNEIEKQVKEESLNQTLGLMKLSLRGINSRCDDKMYDDPLMKSALKSAERSGDEETVYDLIDRLHLFLNVSIKHDPLIKKDEKQMKEDFFNIAIDTLKNKLAGAYIPKSEVYESKKHHKSEQTNLKEEKRRKDDFEEYDEFDEAYDYGFNAFDKLFKNSISGQKRLKDTIKYLNKLETKEKRHKDEIKYEKQRKIRNDDIYEEAEKERNVQKDLKKPIELLKMFYKTLDDKLSSSNEREKRRHVDESKSRTLGRKEPENADERSKRSNRCADKHHRQSSSETKNIDDKANEDIFNMNKILDRMKSLFDFDPDLKPKESNKKPSYNDNYNAQTRQLDMTRKDESVKETNTEVDFNNIINKIRDNLFQRSNKQVNSAPKQVRQSSPYSYQRPPHGTTTLKSLGTQQNQHDNVSFKIQPQEYSNTNFNTSGNHQINYNKSSADEDKDFMPWWFGNTGHSINNVMKEPLVQAAPVTKSLQGNSMFNDSFFDNFLGKNFPTPQLSNF